MNTPKITFIISLCLLALVAVGALGAAYQAQRDQVAIPTDTPSLWDETGQASPTAFEIRQDSIRRYPTALQRGIAQYGSYVLVEVVTRNAGGNARYVTDLYIVKGTSWIFVGEYVEVP